MYMKTIELLQSKNLSYSRKLDIFSFIKQSKYSAYGTGLEDLEFVQAFWVDQYFSKLFTNDPSCVYITTGSVITNQSQEQSLSFSPIFNQFECNITSDWLNRVV